MFERVFKRASPCVPGIGIRQLRDCFAVFVDGEEKETPVLVRVPKGFAGQYGPQMAVPTFSSVYDLPDDVVPVFTCPLLDQEFDQAAVPIKELHVLPPFGRTALRVPWVGLAICPGVVVLPAPG